MQSRAKCIWDAKSTLGEGPLFDPRINKLLWVDIRRRGLFSYDVSTGERQQWQLPVSVTAMGLRRAGGYICACFDGIYFMSRTQSPANWAFKKLDNPENDKSGMRFNDGAVDIEGGFVCGSMDNSEIDADAGSWWGVDTRLSISSIDSGYHVTNGPAFDAGRKRIYLNDSARRIIYCAEWENQKLTSKREFIVFDSTQGHPDGAFVDQEGGLWVAFWDGWCVRRISPYGTIEQEIGLPIQRPTSLALVNGLLYVTSARDGLTEQELSRAPLSGGLFEVKVSAEFEQKPRYFEG